MTTANTATQPTNAAPSKVDSMIAAYNEQEVDEGVELATDDTSPGEDYVEDTAFDGEAVVNDAGVADANAAQEEATSPQDPQAQDGEATEQAAKPDDKAQSAEPEETYEVEDANGIKRKVAVKFDAKTRKKLVHAAAQRQRFQAERDRAVKALNEAQDKLTAYNKLNEAWTSSADPVERVKALVSTLQDGGAAFDAAIAKELDIRDKLAKASPQERAAWESEQARKRAETALASERKKIDADRKAAQEKAEAAEAAANESAVQSVFDTMRFSGKLGDEVLADRLDRQVFAASIGSIQSAIDNAKKNGTPLTAAQVSSLAKSAFKEHFSALKGLIKEESKKGAAAAVDNAKTNAANKASSLVENQTKAAQSGKPMKSGTRASMRSAILASYGK